MQVIEILETKYFLSVTIYTTRQTKSWYLGKR